MNRIDGKIAVVTGGTQGLGAAVARLFAEAGAAGIVIVGRGAEKGRAKAEEITNVTGVPVHMVAANLANMDDVRDIMIQTDKLLGRVDILVNAAGLTDRGNLLNTSQELFDEMIAVNTRAPFFLIQDAVKIMNRERIEGRIVNIGSASGQVWPTVPCALCRVQRRAFDFDTACWLCVDAQSYPCKSTGHWLDEFR